MALNPLPVIAAFLLFLPNPSRSQDVPSSVQAAEQSSNIPVINPSYNMYSYTTQSGSRTSASVTLNHTFGANAESTRSGNGFSSNTASLGLDSPSGVSTSLGENKLIRFSSNSVQSGTIPGAVTPDLMYSSSVNQTTEVVGAGALGDIKLQKSTENCTTTCAQGSYFKSESSTSSPSATSSNSTDNTSTSSSSSTDKNSNATGKATGFLNTMVSTDSNTSAFTTVIFQAF